MKISRWFVTTGVLVVAGMFMVTCVVAQRTGNGDAQVAPAGEASDLTVKITDLKGKDGAIVISLFTKSDGFPGDISKAVKTATVATDQPIHKFTDLPAGKYVVVVFHDKNKNGKLDKLAIGLPNEPIGLSNHPIISPPANMPNFDRAKVDVSKATSVEVNLIEIGR